MGGRAKGGNHHLAFLDVGETFHQAAHSYGGEQGDSVVFVDVELCQVARYLSVHRCPGVFEFALVQCFGVFGLFLVGAGKEVSLVAVLAHYLQQVHKVARAEEDLALPVLDEVLQIKGYLVGGAEVFHVFAYRFAQFFHHAEEMVDGVLAVEYHCGVVLQVDAGFAKLRCGDAHHLKKLVESYVHIVILHQIPIRRLL